MVKRTAIIIKIASDVHQQYKQLCQSKDISMKQDLKSYIERQLKKAGE